MSEKIARVIACESQRVVAAKIEAAEELAAVTERNHRDAPRVAGIRADELMIAGREFAQPWLRKPNILRRQAGHGLDHDEVREVLGGRCVREQEMANVVVGVANDETDVIDAIADAQTNRQR